ncbi:MAG: hypothetical protein ISP10_01815 [Aeromicrobium sp.]|mgnify:CR=1 FL=1|jgi:uncharacterized membrane protein YhaH (DUF805 family)|nr:hypothetical protein [Aeromicrobium sp.]
MSALFVPILVSNAILGFVLLSGGRLRRRFWYLLGVHVLLVVAAIVVMAETGQLAQSPGAVLASANGIAVFVAGCGGAVTAAIGRLMLNRFGGSSPGSRE